MSADEPDCFACGGLTGLETAEYQTPVHNGVYAEPTRVMLCEGCAMEVAELMQRYFDEQRAHAAKCGVVQVEQGVLDV